ncbi:hypothetical protein THAOC_08661, partial [Thalassiosira oceanica]
MNSSLRDFGPTHWLAGQASAASPPRREGGRVALASVYKETYPPAAAACLAAQVPGDASKAGRESRVARPEVVGHVACKTTCFALHPEAVEWVLLPAHEPTCETNSSQEEKVCEMDHTKPGKAVSGRWRDTNDTLDCEQRIEVLMRTSSFPLQAEERVMKIASDAGLDHLATDLLQRACENDLLVSPQAYTALMNCLRRQGSIKLEKMEQVLLNLAG